MPKAYSYKVFLLLCIFAIPQLYQSTHEFRHHRHACCEIDAHSDTDKTYSVQPEKCEVCDYTFAPTHQNKGTAPVLSVLERSTLLITAYSKSVYPQFSTGPEARGPPEVV